MTSHVPGRGGGPGTGRRKSFARLSQALRWRILVMRSVFAALGYTCLFGAVVGAIWLRYPPHWMGLEQASIMKVSPASDASDANEVAHDAPRTSRSRSLIVEPIQDPRWY